MDGNNGIRNRFTPNTSSNRNDGPNQAGNGNGGINQAVNGNGDARPPPNQDVGHVVLDMHHVEPVVNQAVTGELAMRHGMARGVVGGLMSIAARIAVPFVVRSVPVLGNHATGEALALTMAFRLGRQVSDTADHLLGGVIQDQQARGRVANALGGIAGMAAYFVGRQASPVTIANSALTAILNRAITSALSHFGATFSNTIGPVQARDALASEHGVRFMLAMLASALMESPVFQLPRDSIVRPITSGVVALFATLAGSMAENSLRTGELAATDANRPGALSSIVRALIGPFVDGSLSPATSIMTGLMVETYSPEANGQDRDVYFAVLATMLNELSTMTDGILDRVLASANRPDPDLGQ